MHALLCKNGVISIHALREEGDHDLLQGVAHADEISIHALREEGDDGRDALSGPFRISIHALREEGDLLPALRNTFAPISIHALREEGDKMSLIFFRAL